MSKKPKKANFLSVATLVLGKESDKWTESCQPGSFFFFFDYHISEVHVNASDHSQLTGCSGHIHRPGDRQGQRQ